MGRRGIFVLFPNLGENIGRTLTDKNHSRILYDPPPGVVEIKTKINKLDPN